MKAKEKKEEQAKKLQEEVKKLQAVLKTGIRAGTHY
jgi:hypothetical protein